MKKIELGKTGIMVSQLGLGTIKFGTSVGQEQCEELMDFYVENGGNFIDTANAYAYWIDGFKGGESEEVIGRWMEKRNNRKNLIIATKLGALPEERDGKVVVQGNSREVIFREVELSLKRLKTDYIDLLYLHMDDRDIDLRESLIALNELKEMGKIKAYGASNFMTWRLAEARQICKEENIEFFATIQQKYSYLNPVSDYMVYGKNKAQFVNKDMLDYIESYRDISLVAYSVLLKGQYTTEEILDIGYDTKENIGKLRELQEQELNPNKWVLDWVCEQLGGSIALMTTSSIKHLKENMGIN